MNLFVFSDESGVLDKKHEKYFVYGGLIFLSKEDKDIFTRKYIHAERTIRKNGNYGKKEELKATRLSNKDKGKLFRACNSCQKFGAVVKQSDVLDSIFAYKKSKQRYSDFVYKIALKRTLEKMMQEGQFSASDVKNIHCFADEHTIATDGLYDLKDGLLKEFKEGTYNYDYNVFYPPIFSAIDGVYLTYCNSADVPLIRAADIIANKIYYSFNHDVRESLQKDNLNLVYFPKAESFL